MRAMFIGLLMLFTLLLCAAEETVTITINTVERKDFKRVYSTEKKEYPISTEQLIMSYPMQKVVLKMEGVEKLVNLKRIAVWMDLDDYSFLEKLVNLEVLIIATHEVVDFNLLKNLPKLRVLYIEQASLKKSELDFINNKELEFVYLSNLRGEKELGLYELAIKNVPKFLKCVDLSISAFVIINNKLLDSLSNVDRVFVYKEPYFDPNSPFKIDDGYLKKHKNIKLFGDTIDYNNHDTVPSQVTLWVEKNIPEKYQRKNIYALFGLDADGLSLTGEDVYGP